MSTTLPRPTVERDATGVDGEPIPPAWEADYWRIAHLIADVMRTVSAARLRPETPIAEQVAAEVAAHSALLRAVIDLAKRANGGVR